MANLDFFSSQPTHISSNPFPEIQSHQGDFDLLNLNCISVVGSRSPSSKGLDIAKSVSSFLIDEDYVVVSGLAKGIDTMAHNTALNLKGKTIAVLGTPLHKIYPAENKFIATDISNFGLLVTTAKEGETFGKHLFPRRNKLMAKISKATIVIDAGEKSGVIHQCKECLSSDRLLVFSKYQADKNYEWVNRFINSKTKSDYVKVFETKKELQEILSAIN